jgi:hypothetical protein
MEYSLQFIFQDACSEAADDTNIQISRELPELTRITGRSEGIATS